MADDEGATIAPSSRMSAVQWWQLSAFTACNCGIILGNALPASLRVTLVAICVAAGIWALNVRYPRETIAEGIRQYVTTHSIHGLGRLLFVMNIFFALAWSSGDGRSLFFFVAAAMAFVTWAAPRPRAATAASTN